MIKKKIVSKNFWWKLLLIVIGYLGVMLGVFFYAFNRVKTDTKTASADTITTTPYCKTIGTTTVDGSSSTGSPDCFAVYMHGLNNSGIINGLSRILSGTRKRKSPMREFNNFSSN